MQDDKTKSIISYIVPICAIIFLVQKDSSRNVKFHCAQAIVIFVCLLILSFMFGFISGLTGIGLISKVPAIFYIAFMVIGIVRASNNENPELPIIGDITKSIFGKVIDG